jgi:SAM-dependent methyltransferase
MLAVCRKIVDRMKWEWREWRRPSRPAFIHDEIDRALFHEIRWRPSGRALDVGCAHGIYMQELGKRGVRAIGVDLNMNALKKAAATGKCVAAADGMALPFADATFEALLCHKTLHLFRDPIEAARELARVIRPGGRLVFSTSNAVSPYTRVQSLALRRQRNRNWSRGNNWSASQWSRAFFANGLTTRAIYSCNLVWPIVFRVCDSWIVPNEWMRRYTRGLRRITRLPLRTDHPLGAAMDYVIEMVKSAN